MNYSVLTSVYWKEKPEYLKSSIQSILNQTIPTNDFVIVKDGPLTDELEAVIDMFIKDNKNIRIVSLSQNVGLGNALNAGLKVCRNELVARMDTDDIAVENRFEIQLAEFERDQRLDILGSYMYEFIDNPENIVATKVVPLSHDQIFNFGKRRNPFNHPSVMYKRSVILKYNGYSSMRQGQDLELFTRLLFNGCKGKNIERPLIKFRSNIEMHKRRKSWTSVKNYIEVIYKSWKMGYSGLIDLLYVIVLQFGLLVLPTSIGMWIYRNIFRK
jgi:glycosyltransferase involved in cell wall biosynthesis